MNRHRSEPIVNRDDLLFEYLQQQQPKPFCWLDVGAGTGRVSMELERRGCGQSTRIDVQPRDPTVSKFDGQQLAYEENSYDFVLFNFVLHHAASYALPLLRDALRIATRAVIIQEDIDDGSEQVREAMRQHDPNAIFYSKSGWFRIFSDLGTEVLRFEEFPEFRLEDHSTYSVPRAFAAIRASS